MGYIRFLNDEDLRRIRHQNPSITLERGHILYDDNGRTPPLVDIIAKSIDTGRRKLNLITEYVENPDRNMMNPGVIVDNKPYSGSLIFGNHEQKVMERLRKLYDLGPVGGISAEEYDFYSKVVSTSREDVVNPATIQGIGAFLGGVSGMALSAQANSEMFEYATMGILMGGAGGAFLELMFERYIIKTNSKATKEIRSKTAVL